MSRAFDEFTAEPVDFDENYILSGNLYPTAEEAAKVYSEYFEYEVKPDELWKTWCHWHGGIDDDGEMHNGWWSHDSYKNKRGAQPAWGASRDWHKTKTGHSFKYPNDKYDYYADCMVCGGR